MGLNQLSFLKSSAALAGAWKYLLPYLIGAQFGGAAGFVILQSPLSVEQGIDFAITLVILLAMCRFMDRGGIYWRFVSNGFALSAKPNA